VTDGSLHGDLEPWSLDAVDRMLGHEAA